MAKTKRAETYRLKRLVNIEEQKHALGFTQIAGVDEAGRGPLAGPLVAAACILPLGFVLRGIDDSKKLSPQERYGHYQQLVVHPDVIWGVGVAEAGEIDQLNIHQATLLAFTRAVSRLKSRPSLLLVDGKYPPKLDIPAECIVDGDQKAQAIAAASVIAKVTRDHIMIGYDSLFPEYGFKAHKGYGTKQHREAIQKHGMCPIHRRSFIKEEKW